jgi:hypothetical protein
VSFDDRAHQPWLSVIKETLVNIIVCYRWVFCTNAHIGVKNHKWNIVNTSSCIMPQYMKQQTRVFE